MAEAACSIALDLLDAALAYARRGWAVVPLHSPLAGGCSCGRADCSTPAKHPRTAHGVKEATVDRATIRRWWTEWPHANVGIATGAISGIVVLDVDPRHGGEGSLLDLEAEHGPLLATLVAETGGGGRHLVFRHPGRPVKNKAGLVPGIDVRGDGGYIVAPPSRHASGGSYRWK